MAIGLIEVLGFSVALDVADAMCKAALVVVEAFDANNPPDEKKAKIPVVIQVRISGGVADIKAALEVGRRTAQKYLDDRDILTHCIAAEHSELQKLLHCGKLMAPPAENQKKTTPAANKKKKGDADEN